MSKAFNKLILKLLKFVVTLLLIPVTIGTLKSLADILIKLNPLNKSVIPLFLGTLAYPLVQTVLPKPMKLYTFAHELTHAITSMIFGGKVKQLRIHRTCGNVVVTKSNFVVVLAPYFFPFYAVIVLILWHIISLYIGQEKTIYYYPWYMFVLGLTIGFHLVMTWYAINIGQPDIKQTGIMFSLVFVLLSNCLFITLILKLIAYNNVSLKTFVVDITSFQIKFWVYAYIYAKDFVQYIKKCS